MDTMFIHFLLDEMSYKLKVCSFSNLISHVLSQNEEILFHFKHVNEMLLDSNDADKL